jgi:type I restriction enzyme, S subunit
VRFELRKAAIAEIADVIRGVSFDKKEVATMEMPGYAPILRAGNISERLVLDKDLVWVPEKRLSSDQWLKRDDIAICMSSGSPSIVGKSAFLEETWHGGVGAFCAVIRPRTDKVLPAFLSFYMKSAVFRHWTSQSAGINIKNIRKSELQSHQLSLPSLEEQRRIVDILSRAEGIVRLRREAQKKAGELIPALFLEMFGDPAANPKGWPVAKVDDIIISANYGSSKKASENEAGPPIIRMGNVDFAGYLKLNDLKYVELPPEDTERFGLIEGDILFNRTNSKDLVGKTGMWDGSRTAVAASYFIRVRVQRDRINPYFFWAFMNSAHMKHMLFDTARGAIGQANINARELRAFSIIVPPLNRQDTYEQCCRDIFSIQTQQASGTQKAETTFEVLLSRIFRCQFGEGAGGRAGG